MNTMNTDPVASKYCQSLAQAVACLQSFRYEKAYEDILEAMEERPDAPQPHNLLGIYYELGGEIDLARRHYRAAYSLDPTFSPACRNLEQISLALSNERPRIFDFGEAFC